MRDESRVMIRAAYFRICADSTLRGPDNAVVSRYLNGLWQLSSGRHRAFDCSGPVFLRVTGSDGRIQRVGPLQLVKVTGGAIFADNNCLAVHESRQEPGPGSAVAHCREVTLLSSA